MERGVAGGARARGARARKFSNDVSLESLESLETHNGQNVFSIYMFSIETHNGLATRCVATSGRDVEALSNASQKAIKCESSCESAA